METLMLAAIVSLAGLGIWRAQQYFPNLRLSAGNSIAYRARADLNRTELDEGRPAEESKKHHAARSKGSFAAERESDFANADDSNVERIVVSVPNPPFPSSEKLLAGVTRAQLRKTYGSPDLQVAEMRDGNLFEEYYYFNDDHTRFTLAIFEDGRLISAETKSR